LMNLLFNIVATMKIRNHNRLLTLMKRYKHYESGDKLKNTEPTDTGAEEAAGVEGAVIVF